jgi:hypothetical protein
LNYCSELVALKRRSLRRGIWFRVLNGLERAQVDLTVRVVERVRSSVLARVLASIINKLSQALESRVSASIKTVGFPSALRLSRIAQSWGYESAEEWIGDSKFARFLAILHLNSGSPYSVQGQNP